MSDDTTRKEEPTSGVVETRALDLPVYAWGEEPEEETKVLATIRRRLFDARIIPAVITGVAVAAVSIAGTLALTPGPDHFTIRPAPVEQVPAPKVVAPKPVQPPIAAPPAVVVPPVQHLVQPPDARQTFTGALRGDTPETQGGNGLYPTDSPAAVDSEAAEMCRDLANGGSVQPYIDGTLRKSPTLAPWQAALAVHQAIRAYCPQYDNG